MKYFPFKSFGYPVLAPHSGDQDGDEDYVGHTFEPSFYVTVPPDKPNVIRIEVENYFSVPSIKLAVTSKNAMLLLNVSCRDTFFSKCFEVPIAGGTIEMQGDMLSGQVDYSLFIRADKKFILKSDDINHEFGYKEFEVSPGSLIAQSATWRFLVNKEFYRNPRSIITINVDPELKDGEFIVSLDNPYIEVSTSAKLNKQVNGMMASEISKTYAINALYVPVVTHALTVLEQREELLENKWAQVLTSQLATIRQDHDVRDERHNEAQALFRFPLSVISMEGS
ncbi:hypothetical protein OAT86_01115 [Planktomarina sp.]|nr:hypothetical protein [Planktomarina temperata]MDC3221842.1 hypothetical protein [Planktomarina sp.]